MTNRTARASLWASVVILVAIAGCMPMGNTPTDTTPTATSPAAPTPTVAITPTPTPTPVPVAATEGYWSGVLQGSPFIITIDPDGTPDAFILQGGTLVIGDGMQQIPFETGRVVPALGTTTLVHLATANSGAFFFRIGELDDLLNYLQFSGVLIGNNLEANLIATGGDPMMPSTDESTVLTREGTLILNQQDPPAPTAGRFVGMVNDLPWAIEIAENGQPTELLAGGQLISFGPYSRQVPYTDGGEGFVFENPAAMLLASFDDDGFNFRLSIGGDPLEYLDAAGQLIDDGARLMVNLVAVDGDPMNPTSDETVEFVRE